MQSFFLYCNETDLSKAKKFATLPNLRVRRRSRVIIGNNSSDDETLSTSSSKLRGPEFILNSSLPSQEIDISDSKVCPKLTLFTKKKNMDNQIGTNK